MAMVAHLHCYPSRHIYCILVCKYVHRIGQSSRDIDMGHLLIRRK